MNTKQISLIFILVCIIATVEWWYPENTTGQSYRSERTRFPVLIDGLWGYIDVYGQIQIKPQFIAATDFTEGLAAVRHSGTYGYIDTSGKYIIDAQFDFAEEFKHGIARVYIDSRPYYINREGKILFGHEFEEIEDFNGREYTIATTKTGNSCILGVNGEMLTDTIFHFIRKFSEGKITAFVSRAWMGDNEINQWDTNYTASVIDSAGNWLIYPGKYTRIQEFSEGKAHAERLFKDEDGKWQEEKSEFIDKNGNVLFSIKDKPYSVFTSYAQGFREGKLIVSLWDSAHEDLYPGVINENGELLFSNEDFSEITPYQNGIAFVQLAHSFKWIMIDEQGQQLYTVYFDDVIRGQRKYDSQENAFTDRQPLCKIHERGWCMINSSGKPIDSLFLGLPESYVEFRSSGAVILRDTVTRLWFLNKNGLMKEEFKGIDENTIDDNLIRVAFKGDESGWGYVNRNGQAIWKNSPDKKLNPEPLNIDYMNWTNYHVGSIFPDSLERGGWWASDNYYRSMDSLSIKNDADKMTVYIDTSRTVEWSDKVSGYPIFIINGTTDTMLFSAQDSNIELMLEAKDKDGSWKNIQYQLSSWCGNSYHTLFLPPQSFWELSVPRYTGSYNTSIRAKVTFRELAGRGDDIIIYSNEIAGSVNPAQFWRKRDYYPQGIMDPYND